jgi:signal transduction histidine kinase
MGDQLEAVFMTVHELRTPLSAMAMSCEMLQRDATDLDRAEIEDLTLSVQRSVIWMQWLVDNLLCAAELDRGGMTVSLRPVHVDTPVLRMHQTIAPVLARRQQRLVYRWRGPRVEVLADERRIQQVLLNLVANASKFSDVGTSITISASHRDGRVRLAVADHGPGVQPEAIPRLFRPFSRAADAIRNAHDGFGLGLAIVQAIVAQHGGSVGVTNRRRGGACFWFELPAATGAP